METSASVSSRLCYFCGYRFHPRNRCPARNKTCRKCGVQGHFDTVCQNINRSRNQSNYYSNRNGPVNAATAVLPNLSAVNASTQAVKSMVKVDINGSEFDALVDSGSDLTFGHPEVVKSKNLKTFPINAEITMADTGVTCKISLYFQQDIIVNNKRYKQVKFLVMPGLCADLILGRDFQSRHQSVVVNYGGAECPLIVGALGTLKIEPRPLFPHLTKDVRPIASKSRRYSLEDREFIKSEVERLLTDGIIEKSDSPWRAQIVVDKKGTKKRMCIDYSTTINTYTYLDAYPLPLMKDVINNIAKYKIYSTLDLRSAFNQIPLIEADKKYTAFEADGQLYHFNRLPFGVTNGVAMFQRTMDSFIQKYDLKGTFAYLDNLTVCGLNQEEHDRNLQRFMEAAKEINLTFNEGKCEYSTNSLRILGSLVKDGNIYPDPDRLKPLRDLCVPQTSKALKRAMGFFSYYSKFIQNFSKKIRPLSKNTTFPMSKEAEEAFSKMKKEIENSVVAHVDDSKPFVLETDASDEALGATLLQSGRPVDFFSRTLRGAETKLPSIEKEALSVIESVRHWRHYLTYNHFVLRTDQRSISYIFSKKHRGKIKNIKLERWRMELSTYSFDIQHIPGELNISSDTMSRGCSAISENKLSSLHASLCHPGITRMFHFVKSKNLPYTLEEVRKITRDCSICAETKPRFVKPPKSNLIKSTQPFERISVDFKGPLPSTNKNIYLLDIVDEYSRFCWAIPCSDMSASTIIKAFTELFSVFGLPSYVHTDRGTSFMSKELKNFLLSKGISSSRSTPYHPQSNGQIEKTNGTIWKTITLALKSHNLPLSCWQEVLPEALHSIRSLLCVSTNETPHERLFKYQRRSASGESLPTWLSESQYALLRRFVRNSKQDPLVDEVQIVELNPSYAHVRFKDGRESTVSISDLAPPGVRPSNKTSPSVSPDNLTPLPNVRVEPNLVVSEKEDVPTTGENEDKSQENLDVQTLRRSERNRAPPERFVPG